MSVTERASHENDEVYHEGLNKVKNINTAKYTPVTRVHEGLVGRRLIAKRLLYSVDLYGMESRLKYATEQPYRPRLSDPGDKYYTKLFCILFYNI